MNLIVMNIFVKKSIEMKTLNCLAISLLATALVSCSTERKTDTSLPRANQTSVNTEHFDSVFHDVYSHLTEELHSMIVIKDGEIIYEKYATGHNAQEHHVLWSATKTFTATAVGFARQDGLLDVNDPILKYFNEDEIPAGHSPLLDKVTIHDLLTMGSGIGDGEYNFEKDKGDDINPVRHLLEYPMEAEPGSRFRYNNNDTHLAGIIVSRVTGKTLSEYLDEKLFSHLGIVNYEWWKDPAGNNIGPYGLFLTAENFAKMALFMLQRGEWNGEQLLGEDWFDMAMSEQIFQQKSNTSLTEEDIARMHEEDDWASGYGYQMWMCKGGRGCRLDGANGQFGIIMPQKNAVAVMFSKCWNTSIEMNSFWKNVYSEL